MNKGIRKIKRKRRKYRKDIIYSAVRGVCSRNIVVPFIALLAMIGIYYLLPFSEVFNPVKVTSSREAESLYNKGMEYAVIRIDKLFYTGYDIMSDGEVVASYYYDLTDGRCTFYILGGSIVDGQPKELEDVTLNVKLSKINGLLENMMNAFAGSLGWNSKDMLSITSKAVMNQIDFHVERYAAGFAVLVLGAAYCSVIITANMLCIIFPFVHITLLRHYAGKEQGRKAAVDELRQELKEKQQLKAGNMYITENYFMNLGKREITLIPIKYILLGYEHNRLLSIFGFHVRATHTLYFRGLNGEKIVASGKRAVDVIKVTNFIKENYPDIRWGQTKENNIKVNQIIKKHKKAQKSPSHD